MHKKPIKKYAPFGVNTKRFNKIGFHPNLDVSGAMKKEITKTGPGSYNTKKYTCTAKSNTGFLLPFFEICVRFINDTLSVGNEKWK